MANHSPEKDNYVSKKTFETALEGGKPDVKPEGTRKKAEAENQARGNGSGDPLDHDNDGRKGGSAKPAA